MTETRQLLATPFAVDTLTSTEGIAVLRQAIEAEQTRFHRHQSDRWA